ncbi:MAG: alternative ribosome rescue aminoacyl-tRNA hydrolase ArfB [Breznakibacter sp.]
MDIRTLQLRGFENEWKLTAVRSAGPGGQNVNKVNSKVELRFHVTSSHELSDAEKTLVLMKLANRINVVGELLVTSQTERSQHLNKERAIERFFQLLATALMLPTERKTSKPTQASKLKRLEQKRLHSTRKKSRRRVSGED